MAKDPAFLFYPNDWIGGTMGMNFEEKGAYMELLMLQFNRGHMTTHMIGQTVGQIWDKIKDKFIQDENGLWFNQRLEFEKNKRKAFADSRRNNISGKNQYSNVGHKKGHINGHKVGHMTSHMIGHMENGNVNENINEKESIKQAISKNKIEMPEISEMLNFAKSEIEKLGYEFSKFEYPMKSKIETWQENGWKDGHNKPIKNWKSKIKNIIPFLKPMAAPQNQILEKGLEEARKNFIPTGYTPRNIEKELEIARNNFKPTEYAD